MALIACGLNHKTAAIALREQVCFSAETAPVLLRDLISCGAANEAMILSTCNRTEFYLAADNPVAPQQWLNSQTHIDLTATMNSWYYHYDYEAVRHMMRVASGLDSMVLGEPQILGQMKQAYTLAQQSGSIGSQLQRLVPTIFTTSKQIRTLTKIGANPISMAYAIVQLAKQIFADLANCAVLFVGTGEMIELAATHLASYGSKRMIFANRSPEKAQQLAVQFHGHYISLADIPVYLPQADIIVTATSSPLPLIGKGAVERALKLRKHRPMFMVDLAVPRDIEPEIAKLADIYLYNIDDLKIRLEENLKSREHAAKQAEEMIEIEAKHFMRQLQALDADETICALRDKIAKLGEQSVAQALSALQRGEQPDKIINQTVRDLINKITHTPSKQLRQAAFDGQLEILLNAKRLFDL